MTGVQTCALPIFGVLNREAWRYSDKWTADFPKAYRIAEDGGGVPPVLFASEAIAIALALDEQSRRKLPEMERAQWACQMLNAQEYRCLRWTPGGYHAEAVWGHAGEYTLVTLGRSVAVAIAESLVRREMLGDTSDANAKGVKP